MDTSTSSKDAGQSRLNLGQDNREEHQEDIAFIDIIRPIAIAAEQKLRETSEHYTTNLIGAAARDDFRRTLERRLAEACEQALYLEFSVFRCVRSGALNSVVLGDSKPYRTLYRKFINQFLGDGWPIFLQRYPALAVLIRELVKDWCSFVSTLIERYSKDRKVLQTAGILRGNSKTIVRANLGLGDYHNGSSVSLLTFEDGEELIYKPRPQVGTKTWGAVVEWFHKVTMIQCICLVSSVLREDYGWFAVVLPPSTNSEWMSEFWFNYGALAGIAHVTGVRDLHFENVMLDVQWPVAIDVETVLSPTVKVITAHTDTSGTSGLEFGESAAQTGLLPRWELAGGNSLIDYSPLTFEVPDNYSNLRPIWDNINTDLMAPCSSTASVNISLREAYPTQGQVADQLDRIVSGFRFALSVAYRNATNLKDLFRQTLRKDSLSRVVLRPTRFYYALYYASLHPRHLRVINGRRVMLEAMLRLEPNDLDDRRFHDKIMATEVRSLEKGDVPIFFTKIDSRDILNDNLIIASAFFYESGLEAAVRRLSANPKHEIEVQTQLVRNSFQLRFGINATPKLSDFSGPQLDKPVSKIESTIGLLEEELVRWSTNSIDAYVNWPSAGIPDQGGRFTYSPVDFGLYSGKLGTALTLAALDSKRSRQLSESCENELYDLISSGSRAMDFLGKFGLGLGYGLGSVLYCAAVLATLSGSSRLTRVCDSVVLGLTGFAMQSRSHDLLSGLPGLLVGLIASGEAFKCGDLLDLALEYGSILAHSVIESLSSALDKRNNHGLAHGLHGPLLALSRVYAKHKNPIFLQAMEYLTIEIKKPSMIPYYFDRRHGGFDRSAPNLSWCWGVCGEITALIEANPFVPLGNVLKERLEVLEAACTDGQCPPVDMICCGSAGVIETLLELEYRSKEKRWLRYANRLAEAMLTRAKISGGLTLHHSHPGAIFNPSFFRGTAGIAWSLLRLSNKQRSMPSVTWFTVS